MTRPLTATLVLGFGTLVSHGFGLSLVPAMLPRIANDFGAGYGRLGVVVAMGLVSYSAGALSSGRIVDRAPARGLLIATYALTGCGLLIAAGSSSSLVLTAAVVVLGFSAPVSWSVTLHIAGATIAPGNRSLVMAGASSGAALGVLVNGVLVQTSANLHSWRLSFVLAAILSVVPMAGTVLTFRSPITATTRAIPPGDRSGFRQILQARAGRISTGAALAAGAAGFPFSVFLTATALDEIEVGSLSTAVLWWLIGGIGILAGPLMGRFGDRASPLTALAAGTSAYAIGLVVLAVTWSYAGLLVAVIGFTLMNSPLWGLVGAVADRHFEARLAVRSVGLGLVGAAAAGALTNAAAGAWIEATDSFRVPVAIAAGIMAVVSAWYLAIVRRGGLGADTGERIPAIT